jgi:hypothetical protein
VSKLDERPPGDVLMLLQERSRYQVALRTTATRDCECEKQQRKWQLPHRLKAITCDCECHHRRSADHASCQHCFPWSPGHNILRSFWRSLLPGTNPSQHVSSDQRKATRSCALSRRPWRSSLCEKSRTSGPRVGWAQATISCRVFSDAQCLSLRRL